MPLSTVLSVVFLGLAAVPAAAQRGPTDRAGLFQVGRRAPALELPTLDGRATRDLGAPTGKKTILLLFASW